MVFFATFGFSMEVKMNLLTRIVNDEGYWDLTCLYKVDLFQKKDCAGKLFTIVQRKIII